MKNLLLLLGITILFSSANAKSPFSVEDIITFEKLSNLTISPSGRFIAYVKSSPQGKASKPVRNIWMVDLENQALTPKQVTFGQSNDYHPRWSQDNRHLYFISDRSKRPQVWKINVFDGVNLQITQFDFDINTYNLSPDESYLAITTNLFPDCFTITCSKKRDEAMTNARHSGKVYDKLFVRHWDKWQDHKLSRLFTVPLKANSASNKLIDISGSVQGNVPSQPFGSAGEIAFSRDGQSIFFTSRIADKNEPWSTNFDIYQASSNGQSRPVNLTQKNLAWDTHPRVSPDGSKLAYLAMTRPGFESDKKDLILKDLKTNKVTNITKNWDRSITSFKFSVNGKYVIASAKHLGQQPLFKIDLQSQKVTQLLPLGTATEFVVSKNHIIYGMNDLSQPTNYYSISIKGGAPKQITRVNEGILDNIAMSPYEQFQFDGWNNEKVFGYLVKPYGFVKHKKYPVAFLIHGGPQGTFSNFFHYRWNAQLFAARGFAVVMIDFHGSIGYGQQFTDSISGDWGGKPLVDLKKGLAFVNKNYSWLDDKKVCALGASYGGYMVNWIAGNWPDRFSCLVNHDGVFDNRMMYFSTDELWFVEWEHGGDYIHHPKLHEKFNPVNHVSKWQTPMLLIHGSLDYRIPETHSIAAFTALQKMNIKSRLIIFPDENHHVHRPANKVQWYNEVLSWLDEYLL